MNAKAMKKIAWVLVAAAIIGPVSSHTLAADGPSGIEAFTKPSQDVTLSFDRPGRVAELPAKEGESVTEGQRVARQDDSEEQAALALAKITAEDDTTIKAEQAVLEQKKVDYQNLQKNGAASHYELDQARLEVTVEEAKVTLQIFQQKQNQYKYEQTKAAFDKTRLLSPIAGVVQETKVQVGESVDVQNNKVIRIVKLDPLWIEVPVPFAQGQQLKVNDAAQVTLSSKEVQAGKVTHVAAVADSASDTLLVRVELNNPSQRKAGERVSVSFTAVNVASAQK